MSDRRITFDRKGYSEAEAARFLFPTVLKRRFWLGFLAGAVTMAALNIGDVHICAGECDSKGVDLRAMTVKP